MAKGQSQDNLTSKNQEIEKLKQLGISVPGVENMSIEEIREIVAKSLGASSVMTRSAKENEDLVKTLKENATASPSPKATKIFKNVRDYSKDNPETDPSVLDELATLHKLPTMIDYSKPECVKAIKEYTKLADKVYWAKITGKSSTERNLKAVELLWANDANPSEHGVIILDSDAYKPSLSKNPKVKGQRALPYQAKLLLQVATRTFTEPKTLETDNKINLGSLATGTATVTTTQEIYGNNSYKYEIEIFDELTEDDLAQYYATAKGNRVTKDNIITPVPVGYANETGFHQVTP